MDDDNPEQRELERLPTQVPRLDAMLGGGLLEGSLYLIEGMPGGGKTLLASQICFGLADRGRNVIYLTLVSESHAKLIHHLSQLSFFRAAHVGDRVLFLSGYQELVKGRHKALLELLAGVVRKHKPDLLVIDGFRQIWDRSDIEAEIITFVHELSAFAMASRCTVLLLAPYGGVTPRPEHALVDGLIELTRHDVGMRSLREIEIHKIRAADHMRGRHFFRITSDGLHMFPRLEGTLSRRVHIGEDATRVGFGVARLDAMLRGGLFRGSMTSLAGSPGSGKTLLALSFLMAGVRKGEPALYFGFFEAPARLVAKASGVGLDAQAALDAGLLEISWRPPVELLIDELAHTLLETVERRGIKRVVLDGIEGFQSAAVYPERLGRFLAALTALLREAGVTTVLTEELPALAQEVHTPMTELSAIVENLILMRQVELRSQLYRLISVMKLRESDYDSSIREFTIGPGGIDVAESFESAEAILAGTALGQKRGLTRRRKTSRRAGRRR